MTEQPEDIVKSEDNPAKDLEGNSSPDLEFTDYQAYHDQWTKKSQTVASRLQDSRQQAEGSTKN